MDSKFYENQLLDAIETIVENTLSRAEYDKTIRATVHECLDKATGKYKIKYQDSYFDAYSNDTGIQYSNGTQVYILIPKNDMSQTKVILHAVDKDTIKYAEAAEGSLYRVGSQNMVGGEEYELCSYDGTSEIILYDIDNDIDLLNLDENIFKSKLKQANGILIGANFKTSLPEEQQRKGNYGITYDINFTNTLTSEDIIRTYTVDVNNMNGNPYYLINGSQQAVNFIIDTQNYKNIKRIAIFAKNFPNIESSKPTDIFISNFQLQTTKQVTKGYSVDVNMEKDFFGEDDSIEINVEVLLDGNIIDKQFDYYWLRKNSSIDTTDNKYISYAGAGWECINNSITIDEDIGEVQFIVNRKDLTILKEDCNSKENNFKVVAVSEDLVLQKEFSIINESAGYDITIQSDEGTIFYYEKGSPTLTVLINGEEEKDFNYIWEKVDNNGQREVLEETVESNTSYNDAVAAYENAEPSAAAQYLTIMENYDKIQRVEKNHIYHVDISTIDDYSTYSCSVYGTENEFLGTVSIVLYKKMEAEENCTLEIENGTQTFNYDGNGIAPTNLSLENPIKLLPLKAKMIDSNGNSFGDDLLRNSDICNIKWIIPTNSLIIVENSNDITLEYSLEDRYDINKLNNNTIELELEYKGQKYFAKTNFTFVKDGEPGTNGTGVVCKIVPNTDEELEYYPTIDCKNELLNYTPKEEGKWFKVQLWKNGSKIWEGTDSDENVSVTWGVFNYENFKDKNGNYIIQSPFTFKSSPQNFAINGSYYSNGASIVKVEVEYEDFIYYDAFPMISMVCEGNYKVNLIKNSGYRYVMYNNDGSNPQYTNNNPFVLKVELGDQDETSNLIYDWSIQGSYLYKDNNNKTQEKIEHHLTQISQDKNISDFVPDGKFISNVINNAIEVNVLAPDGLIRYARIHIPIYFYLNRYGMATINAWDGNSIVLKDSEDSVILAPQVGAGYKEKNNTFTGMLMGTVKKSTTQETGLFGYKQGERTIFLDADSGNAVFGSATTGQIKITPKSSTIEGKNGGMTINLNEPSIKWKNGNFSVSKDGALTAMTGHIGRFVLSEYKLVGGEGSSTVGICNTDGKGWAFWAGATKGGDAPFRVGHNGDFYASKAEIKGKITGGSININNKFKVSSNGDVTASNINITGGTVKGSVITSGINANNITAGRLNISDGRGHYLRMGFSEGNNPSVSGLNVGRYGIKASSGIVATEFGITDADSGKTVSFQVPRQGGGYYYITFTGGILTAYERND